jgi:hypothetical protein
MNQDVKIKIVVAFLCGFLFVKLCEYFSVEGYCHFWHDGTRVDTCLDWSTATDNYGYPYNLSQYSTAAVSISSPSCWDTSSKQFVEDDIGNNVSDAICVGCRNDRGCMPLSHSAVGNNPRQRCVLFPELQNLQQDIGINLDLYNLGSAIQQTEYALPTDRMGVCLDECDITIDGDTCASGTSCSEGMNQDIRGSYFCIPDGLIIPETEAASSAAGSMLSVGDMLGRFQDFSHQLNNNPSIYPSATGG